MKIPGKEEVDGFGQTLITGFLEGAAVGAPIAYGLRKILDKRTGFRNAGTFPRTLFLIAPSVFIGGTWMEIRSRQFEQDRRNQLLMRGVEQPTQSTQANASTQSTQSTGESKSRSNTSSLDTGISSWIADNKYKCIIAGWATVLGGSFYAVNKDPYLTRSQKIVQARVWAQGATVIMLVASVLLSVGSTQKAKEQQRLDMENSWKTHMRKD